MNGAEAILIKFLWVREREGWLALSRVSISSTGVDRDGLVGSLIHITYFHPHSIICGVRHGPNRIANDSAKEDMGTRDTYRPSTPILILI